MRSNQWVTAMRRFQLVTLQRTLVYSFVFVLVSVDFLNLGSIQYSAGGNAIEKSKNHRA